MSGIGRCYLFDVEVNWSVLEQLALRNPAQRTSQYVKWISGARVMIISLFEHDCLRWNDYTARSSPRTCEHVKLLSGVLVMTFSCSQLLMCYSRLVFEAVDVLGLFSKYMPNARVSVSDRVLDLETWCVLFARSLAHSINRCDNSTGITIIPQAST